MRVQAKAWPVNSETGDGRQSKENRHSPRTRARTAAVRSIVQLTAFTRTETSALAGSRPLQSALGVVLGHLDIAYQYEDYRIVSGLLAYRPNEIFRFTDTLVDVCVRYLLHERPPRNHSAMKPVVSRVSRESLEGIEENT